MVAGDARGAARAQNPLQRLHFGHVVVGLLVVLFVALNLALLARTGVRMGGDSPTYIQGANQLLQGRLMAQRPGLWVGYEGVVAFCQATGIGLRGVVAIQLAVAAIAAVAQYSLARSLAGRWAGLAAAGLLVANPEIARFHSYILTDSLYTSAAILATWGIYQAGERRGAWYILGAGLVLAAALLRPNGWFLLPIAAGYWLVRATPRGAVRWLALGGMAAVLVLGALALPFVRAGVEFEHPGSYLRRGDIVSDYTGWLLPMPVESTPAAGDGLRGTIGYAMRHPVATALLAVARTGAELARVRPFYSTAHNVVALAYVLPLYALAILGYLRVRRAPLAGLLAAVIASHLLFPVFLGADWDGRYLLFTLPLICDFSACPIGLWLTRPWPWEQRWPQVARYKASLLRE